MHLFIPLKNILPNLPISQSQIIVLYYNFYVCQYGFVISEFHALVMTGFIHFKKSNYEFE